MIKIHVGCGKRNFGKDWWHVDGHSFKHVDSKDVCLGMFKQNQVDLIYASHFLEYLEPKKAKYLLGRWLYILKPGGTVRLAVPDIMVMMRLYLDGPYELSDFLGPIYGQMESAGNTIFHKTGYDFRTLKRLLESVGFIGVKLYNWRDTEHSHIDDCSAAYLPHMDFDSGTLISLNVEARK